MRRMIKIWPLLLIVLLIMSCEDDQDPVDKDIGPDDIEVINTEIYETMEDIYLWYKHLPEIDPADYETTEEMMDSIRYEKDRFSYVMPRSEFIQYFEEGTSTGHGIGLATDQSGKLFVAYVYKNTPAYKAGVKRGWKIVSVNETPATSDNYDKITDSEEIPVINRFTFLLPNDSTVKKEIEKKEIDINPVLLDTTYTYRDKKVGYLVFQEFIEVATKYLDRAFEKFNNQNIEYLVIDLRYNSGGFGTVMEHFGNLVAGNDHSNEVYYSRIHNDKHTDKNTTIKFESLEHSLSSLKELYFISTTNTVSASELMMNGLSSHYPTQFIGSKSRGKPVGMYIYQFKYYDLTFAPVSFTVENREGYSEYYDGLPVHYEIEDNIYYNFGDIHEPNLNKALDLIGFDIPEEEAGLKSTPRLFHYIPENRTYDNLYFRY